jgi:hypothetical protein
LVYPTPCDKFEIRRLDPMKPTMSNIQAPYDVFRGLLEQAQDHASYFRCFTYLRDHPELFEENVGLRFMIAAMLAHFSMELLHSDMPAELHAEFSQLVAQLSIRLPPPEGIDIPWPVPITPPPKPRQEPAAPRKRPADQEENYPFPVRRLKF